MQWHKAFYGPLGGGILCRGIRRRRDEFCCFVSWVRSFRPEIPPLRYVTAVLAPYTIGFFRPAMGLSRFRGVFSVGKSGNHAAESLINLRGSLKLREINEGYRHMFASSTWLKIPIINSINNRRRVPGMCLPTGFTWRAMFVWWLAVLWYSPFVGRQWAIRLMESHFC